MGSGSTRPNNADDKMFAAIERGDRDEFKDHNELKKLLEKYEVNATYVQAELIW